MNKLKIILLIVVLIHLIVSLATPGWSYTKNVGNAGLWQNCVNAEGVSNCSPIKADEITNVLRALTISSTVLYRSYSMLFYVQK